ncbi:hypothetical protein [Rhizomonospora bruguierae]|uniref:hypothetical protein n=1 Tax=Rhizomonospora bruguierae TaxID=1581705 RepID=UPI001BCC6B64|nr:hypothetical protein [Micromonospora sp. NBRC 107566]
MRRVITAVVCLVALAGCARPGEVPPPAGPGDDWGLFQADVTAVRASVNPRELVLTVALLASADGCSRDPRIGYLAEENNRVHANVVQESRLSGVVGACPTHTPGEVTLTAREPIGDRIVVLNERPWKRDGTGYHACDETFGCDPMPADHCDPAWISVAVQGMDVSRHSTGSVEACDGGWLVMRVPWDPVPCGAEPGPGCTPSVSVRRYFLRWGGPRGWAVIASTTQAGCATVRGVEPDFPGKLCAKLPQP